ncbi:MAG: sulfatase-like hydrolase/transferase [Armatimonadota bacterium]
MPDRPNILVIMSDQHHAGIMGCAGDPVADTPALDRLAAGGVRFGNAYCPFPLCGPSRMAFMTGRHPHDIEIWTNETQLSCDVPTFAHGLLAAGYETVISGRMHFVGYDQRHGFAQRLLGDVPESAYIAAGWKLQRVLGELIDTPGMGLPGVVKSGPGRTGYHAYDETVTRATVEWLRERDRQSAEAPFLLTVGYASPHCPLVAPPEDFHFFADRITADDLPAFHPEQHPVVADQRRKWGVDPLPPVEAMWRARVSYYGLCRFLDRQVGQVLAALEEAGLAENTLIVYTSDHGEMLGEHGTWWKSTFYDGAERVPLIVSWPGHLAPDSTMQNASLIDIGATLLDLAGAPPLPSAAGRSLRPLLERQGAWDDTVFAEYIAHLDGRTVPCRMVKQGPWKYNYYHGLRPELFNLEDDPGEERDRWDDPACAAIRETLHALALRDWDPAFVHRRVTDWERVHPLIRTCSLAAPLPEPDPVWFDTPPENWHEEVPMPVTTPGVVRRQSTQ